MITSMLPLVGFTVGVTASRKADELIELLKRQGAHIHHAPALRSIPVEDHQDLRTAVDTLMDHPADMFIVTTGVGFRSLMDTVEHWKIADRFHQSLRSSIIITRGAKATGAVRSYNFRESWSPISETSQELLERLIHEGVHNKTIAIQLHGATPEWDPHVNLAEQLISLGAQVIRLPLYRWALPENIDPISQLIIQICHNMVDMMVFTSAPAVLSLFDVAKEKQCYHQLVAQFQHGRCLAVCIGPVTAEPLVQRKIPYIAPERNRLTSMVKELTQHVTNWGICG